MGNLPSTLTYAPPLPALIRINSFSPSTFDPDPDSEFEIPVQAGDEEIDIESDSDSDLDSYCSSTEVYHPCSSSTNPILITTTSLPCPSSTSSVDPPFSESYDSFPDPGFFPFSAPEPGSSIIWSAPSMQNDHRESKIRTRKRATSSASNGSGASASSTSSRTSLASLTSLTEKIGERLSHSVPKVNLHRSPRVDGRKWVVGSPDTLGERRPIRVGYPFYEEVAAKAEMDRRRGVKGKVRKGLGILT